MYGYPFGKKRKIANTLNVKNRLLFLNIIMYNYIGILNKCAELGKTHIFVNNSLNCKGAPENKVSMTLDIKNKHIYLYDFFIFY